MGRQNKWNKLGSVDRSRRNIRIDGDPVFATTVDNLEKPVIALGPLKHLRVEVFVPVIALEGSEYLRIKEEQVTMPAAPARNKAPMVGNRRAARANAKGSITAASGNPPV